MTARRALVRVNGKTQQLAASDSLITGNLFRVENIQATAVGQTSFTVPNGYVVGSVLVWLNGALLSAGDYTATTSPTIVLAVGTTSATDIMAVACLTASTTVSPAMTGASATVAGAAGLVPQPGVGQQLSFLRGDGTWVAQNPAPVTIASAATVAIGAAASNTVNVTGTTTITAFDTIAAGVRRRLIFAGALTLTYNATTLILPGAASVTTVAGDVAEFESLGSGNWKCVAYTRLDGLTLTLGSASQLPASAGNATAGVPVLTASGGQVTLSMTGATARGNLAMATPAADGAGVVAGTVTASGGPSTASATEARVGLFYFSTDGSTAAARGGAFNLTLKADGAAGSFTPRFSINNAGVVTPGSDNAQTLGSASLRWSVVYAGTGTISTSDARDKTSVTALTDAELVAAKALSAEMGTYKFLAAVAAKGEDARLHAGMTVQRAMEIMTASGLEPLDYAFICHDTWEAVDEVLDEDGTVVVAGKEAGDKYSFRPDELLMFIARGFDARLSALEAAAVTTS